jgi:hypothetical protein
MGQFALEVSASHGTVRLSCTLTDDPTTSASFLSLDMPLL